MTPAPRKRLGLVAAFLIGALIALQARINGELGAELDDGFLAALVSFGSGLVLLTIAVACSRKLRGGLLSVRAAVRVGTLRPWHCVGGVFGAFFVACQGITVATIGVALFTVAMVGGQISSSLLVDRAGIGPAGISPVTRTRLIGAGLAVIAVFIALSGRVSGGLGTVGLVILPALAGIGMAWQQAVNGRVGATGGPLAAAWLNFAVGTAALVIVAAVAVLSKGWPTEWPTDPRLYIGGALGIAFIAGAAVVVRWIGVLLLGMTSVAGQLVTAVALDALTPSGGELTVTVLIGCALLLVAVGIAAGAFSGRAPSVRE